MSKFSSKYLSHLKGKQTTVCGPDILRPFLRARCKQGPPLTTQSGLASDYLDKFDKLDYLDKLDNTLEGSIIHRRPGTVRTLY